MRTDEIPVLLQDSCLHAAAQPKTPFRNGYTFASESESKL